MQRNAGKGKEKEIMGGGEGGLFTSLTVGKKGC